MPSDPSVAQCSSDRDHLDNGHPIEAVREIYQIDEPQHADQASLHQGRTGSKRNSAGDVASNAATANVWSTSRGGDRTFVRHHADGGD